jgi:disease resistance protein RPM1
MLSRALKMVADLFVKAKPRRDIAVLIDGIKKQLVEVAERRARYRIDDSLAKPVAPTSSAINPRLAVMYHEVGQLIGIDESRDQVMSMLSCSDQRGNNTDLPDASCNNSIKKVSVVGVGGLGKTTLVKAVYEKLKNEFYCGAFVPVGRNPDLM